MMDFALELEKLKIYHSQSPCTGEMWCVACNAGINTTYHNGGVDEIIKYYKEKIEPILIFHAITKTTERTGT
jgi:hypothetical protein